MKFVKIVVYTPKSAVDKVKTAMFDSGAGKWPGGKYDQVCGRIPAPGQFRPLAGANPAIGRVGQVERVDEVRLEVLCGFDRFEETVKAVKKAHPYEEPAIEVYPLLYP